VNGKLSIVLQTAGLETALECRAERLVFLNRRAGCPPGCVPLEPEETYLRLQESLPRYPDPVDREIRATLRDLTSVPSFEMRYAKLTDGVRQLEALLGGS
jgi:hypothetical protein